MAVVRWTPLAQKRAQVNTITVSGTPAAGNVATVTINSKSITYTVVTGDTTSTIATELAALLRASEDGEFALITWTVSAAVITATASTPGVPFTATGSGTLTVASTGGGATTLTAASVATNSSPNDVGNVLNWSGGATPVTGDTIIIENTSEPLLWNLDTMSAQTITAMYVRDTFTPSGSSWIGNPINHPTLGFREFRGTELSATAFTTLEINLPAGAPTGAIQINGSAGQTALKITGPGGGALLEEAVIWRGTHASNAIEVYGGSLLVYPLLQSSTGTAVFLTLKAIDAVVRLGGGVTVSTSAVLTNSILDSRVTVPTVKLVGESEATFRDAAACGTLMAIDEGRVNWNSSGTIAVLKVGSDGIIDFSGAKSTITVGSGTGTVVLEEGATYIDREQRTIAALTTDTLLLDRTSLDKVTLDVGTHVYVDLNPGP